MCPAPRRAKPAVSLRTVPFDDDAEADHRGFRPPPHPDDRLWRHPSEMREHPIVPVGAPERRSLANPVVTTDGGRGPRVHRPGRPWGAVVVAGTVGAVVAGVGVAVLGVSERVVERPVTERVAMDPAISALDAPAGDGETADPRAVTPAVVGLETVGSAAGSGAPAVQGSGLVVRDDGIVVTSAALVVAGLAPRVRLSDGTTANAAVVGADTATGLAVLDLDGGGYTPGVLADPGELVAGDEAFAVATDPKAGGATTAEGIVGGARRYVGPAGTALDGVEIGGAAADVALGGPVVDEQGAVLGVTTAVAPGDAWYVSPVAVTHRVATELVTTGAVRHSWLGVEGADGEPDAPAPAVRDLAPLTSIESEGAAHAGPAPAGTLVTSIVPGSPAADGGLRVGDRVVALDHDEIADMAALVLALRAHAPGERVDVTVERADGSQVTLVIRLAERPATASAG
jgi:putative serine protease PepD